MSCTRPKASGVVPSIVSANCQDHVKWIQKVFQAEQLGIHMSSDYKRVLHCVLALNNGVLYISDYMKEFGQNAIDLTEEPTGFILHLEVADPTVLYNRATSNDATVMVELKVQECGNLYGCFKDPFGFVWGVMKVTEGAGTPGVVPCLINAKEECEIHVEW